MANVQVSGGLQLSKTRNLPQQLETCLLPSSEANNIFLGDVVQIAAGGGSGQIGNGQYAKKVQKTANTGAVYGVVEAFYPYMSNGSGAMDFTSNYRPASTAMYCGVRRFQLGDQFAIMDDGALASGSSGSLGLVNVGLNANLSIATAGSTITGKSNMRLGGASANTTATLQFKIIDVYQVPGNDPTATFAVWIVEPNNIQTSAGGTGVAGY